MGSAGFWMMGFNICMEICRVFNKVLWAIQSMDVNNKKILKLLTFLVHSKLNLCSQYLGINEKMTV